LGNPFALGLTARRSRRFLIALWSLWFVVWLRFRFWFLIRLRFRVILRGDLGRFGFGLWRLRCGGPSACFGNAGFVQFSLIRRCLGRFVFDRLL
jgi:hypothetical protein